MLKQLFPGNANQLMPLLETYSQQLLEPGNLIFEIRKSFVTHFAPLVQEYYRLLCKEAETIDIAYQSQLQETSLDTLLKAALEKDKILQRTTVGPHKDDLKFTLNGHPIKKFGSQGQMKSFLLAIKLAQYEWLKQNLQKFPILVLDDLFDKLDQHRVKRLIEIISGEHFGQIFISDTHLERLKNIVDSQTEDVNFFEIAQGSAKLL